MPNALGGSYPIFNSLKKELWQKIEQLLSRIHEKMVYFLNQITKQIQICMSKMTKQDKKSPKLSFTTQLGKFLP